MILNMLCLLERLWIIPRRVLQFLSVNLYRIIRCITLPRTLSVCLGGLEIVLVEGFGGEVNVSFDDFVAVG